MAKTRKNASSSATSEPVLEEESFDMTSVKEVSSLSKVGLVIAGSVFVLLFVLSLMASSNDGSTTAPPVELPAESAVAAVADDAITSTDFPYLAAACNATNTPAAGDQCNDLGIKYHRGVGVKKDALLARNIYDLGCAKGSMLACANAGIVYSGTDGLQPWPENSVRLLTRACAAEVAHGCAELGYNYQNGIGVAQDKVRARQLYEWACNRGLQKGCDYRDTLDRSGNFEAK
jgi:TPR repeat protein